MLYPILVVEDDPKIGHIVKAYLEGAGYRVLRAEQGKDALETAQKEMLLLVILDLMLPDVSGEELCLKLKDLADTPIIMQFEGYERSVDAHIKNLRRKLDDNPQNPTFIQTIYGVGYRFSGNRDA